MSNPLDVLSGEVVTRIELIGVVRVTFGTDALLQLTIESNFSVTDPDGRSEIISFAPATRSMPRGLDALGALYGEAVESGVVRPDGSFVIKFANGALLTVPVDPNYEAGHLVLGQQYVVIPPGGARP